MAQGASKGGGTGQQAGKGGETGQGAGKDKGAQGEWEGGEGGGL